MSKFVVPCGCEVCSTSGVCHSAESERLRAEVASLKTSQELLHEALTALAGPPAAMLEYCNKYDLLDKSDPEWMCHPGWRRFVARHALGRLG